MIRNWKVDNLTKDTVLKIALGGAFVLVAATSPYFLHQIVNSYFKDKNKKTAYARARKLRQLESKKLISFEELSDGEVKITLTNKGKLLTRKYKLDDLRLDKTKKWDGKWRIIIYDIPENYKQARNAFGLKIRQLGLYPLQKSVLISPCDCMPEIEFLCAVFDINLNKYIHQITAIEIPKEKEVKKWFNL
ncbi:MAG: hypothetical protein WC461_01985 [Candidatus Paceibacterota bacterium]